MTLIIRKNMLFFSFWGGGKANSSLARLVLKHRRDEHTSVHLTLRGIHGARKRTETTLPGYRGLSQEDGLKTMPRFRGLGFRA